MHTKSRYSHRMALRSILLYTFTAFCLLKITGCSQDEKQDPERQRPEQVGFPSGLAEQLPEEALRFNALPPDSSRLGFLLDIAVRQPVFQKAICRHIIDNTKDSAYVHEHLRAYRLLAGAFAKSNILDSVVFYTKAGISKCNNDPECSKELSEFYRDLGNIYTSFSRNSEAIEYFDKAIQAASLSGNTDELFRYITETGHVYLDMNELGKAKECYRRGKEYAEKYDNTSLLVYSLNSLGDISRRQKKHKEAIGFHEQANSANYRLHGDSHEQWACTSIGKNYVMLSQYDSARKYFNLSLNLASKQGSADLQTQAYLNLSICDRYENRIGEATRNALMAQNISEQIPSLDVKAAVAGNLYSLYKSTGDYKEAMENLERLKLLDDSLRNTENVKKFAETEYKLKEDKLLQRMEKDQELFRIEKARQEQEATFKNIIILSVAVISMISIAFGFYVFRSFRQIRAKNRIIEEKQSEILKSIHYARRIQNSLMPTEKYIHRILNRINRNA